MKPDDAMLPSPHWEIAFALSMFADESSPTLSVPEQIASQVGDRILAERLGAGARVGEQELAAEFGVSRGTVREAVRILEREGLITVLPRRGPVVTDLSADELREVFEIRAALFDAVIRRVAVMRPPQLIAIHRAALARLEALAVIPDGGSDYAETTYRLVLATARFAGNHRLQRLLGALSLQTLRYSKLALHSIGRRQRAVQLVRAGLEALERGDAATLQSLTRQLFEESGQEAARLLAEKKNLETKSRTAPRREEPDEGPCDTLTATRTGDTR